MSLLSSPSLNRKVAALKLRPDFFLSSVAFHNLLRAKRAESADIITYTVNAGFPCPISRAICCKPDRDANISEVAIYPDCHAKLYIITWRKRKIKSAFIGSANAVSPTAFEILYELDYLRASEAMKFFDNVWASIKHQDFQKLRKKLK